MTEETEIWGVLTFDQFKAKIAELTKQLGKPQLSKRLSLQADHFKRHDLDTRIRITNGKIELVQKIGQWEAVSRQEIHTPLKLSAPEVLNLYKILINQLPLDNRQTNLIQYQNFIFITPDIEIKLGQQIGKQTVYHYELEANTPSADLEQARNQLKLPDALKQSDESFWADWNQRINLNYYDLEEAELIQLIQLHLNL